MTCDVLLLYSTVLYVNDAYLFECQKKTFPHNLSDFTALLKACIIYRYKVKGSFQLFFAVFLSFFSHFYSFIHIFIAMDYVSSHSIILLCIKFK